MKFLGRRKWWMTALGVWLVWTGLVQLLSIQFAQAGMIAAVLAVAAGVLILLDR
jgi:hypothetical protein